MYRYVILSNKPANFSLFIMGCTLLLRSAYIETSPQFVRFVEISQPFFIYRNILSIVVILTLRNTSIWKSIGICTNNSPLVVFRNISSFIVICRNISSVVLIYRNSSTIIVINRTIPTTSLLKIFREFRGYGPL